MLYFLPQAIWSGTSICFWSGMLTPIMTVQMKQDNPNISENEKLYKSLYALIFLGVGEAAAGPFMGRAIDQFGSKKASFVNMVGLSLTIGF